MLELFNAATAFPTVIYTALLGLVVLFWSLVLVGGTDPDSLELGDGDIHVDGDVHVDGDAHGHIPHGGGWSSSLFGFMNVGSVPVSIVGSATIFVSWLCAMIAELYVKPVLGRDVSVWVIGGGQLLSSGMLGMLMAGLFTRPLRGVFQIHTVHGEGALVDQVCTITSSNVTADFGQAELPTKGASLLLDVRCPRANKLTKGAKAVIVAHDKEKDVYEVGELEPDRDKLSEPEMHRALQQGPPRKTPESREKH